MYLYDGADVSGPGSDHSHSRTIVGIVVGSVVGILLLASVGICVWMKRRRRTGKLSPPRNM